MKANGMMAKRIDTMWKQLAAVVLGLLGFASCGRDAGFVCMYGEPSADFKALGSVKDEDGKPIEGIRVAITLHNYYPNSNYVIYDQNHWYVYDTLYTDSKGAFQLSKEVFDGPDDVTIVFEDIDGEAHGGVFEPVEDTPAVTQTKQKDGAWYGGAFEVESNVEMKKKVL
jgi:putative lipoprotein (rSAM/lipoprotein system)